MRHTPLLLSLVLAAGTISPALAQTPPQLSVVGRAVILNGQQIYSGSGRITQQRVITFAGSPTVLVVWSEQQGARSISHFALSRDGRTVEQLGTTENKVRLRYATFDPAAGEPQVPGQLQAAEHNQLFLVQFVATPLEEMRRDIALLGGQVQRFLTDNTHVVRIAPQQVEQLRQLPHVRWVGAYHPAYRLDPDILNALQGNARAGEGRYSIEVMRSGMAEQQQVADLITKLGGIVDVVTPDQYRMEATLNHEQLMAVMQLDVVNYLEPWRGPGGTDMDIARQIGGAVPLLSGLNMLGQGVRGEVYDTEVQSNHPQWGGQTPLIHGTNGNSGFHGSAVYGINFATGTGNLQATGLMPQREQGIFYWYEQSTQFSGTVSRLTANMEATNPTGPYRSVFQTSSVGSPQISNYSSISAETDDYLFRVDYLSCQSQSNTGNTNSRPQAWAKNIVAVGGVQHNNTLTRADDGPSGASFGLAADGRMKPELAHFYDAIFTTNNSSGYTDFGGTSGATPITAGYFGLLHQMWHEGVWQGFGGGSTVFASRPKSYTARALMINGAYRYPLTQLNRQRQGWGMADMTKLYNDRNKFFIVNGDDPLVNGQTRTYDLLIIGGEPEFRITMVYPDPIGNPAAGQARINDLTLKVTDPNGIVYWGNNAHVNNNYTPPGGAANTIDTVENVFIQNPVAGNWTVQVIASQIVQDGYLATPGMDAVYSLVASNVTLGPPPPTGACCLPDAPCAIMSQANCSSLNGTYRGDNSVCATANCPPVGACCFGNGTCAGMSESACIAAGGTYRGDNTICATANCAGACCMPTGACEITGGPACLAANGIYRGDGSTCATANCPLPPGIWIEQGDAGDMPATAQITVGTGNLLEIRGDGSPTNDIDMYRLRICDRNVFNATTVNGAGWDTQLFLFTPAGMGVVCNDDSTGLQSTLTNQLVPNNGEYLLAISRYNRDPVSAGGLIFGTSTSGQVGPIGPGGGSPITGWLNSATGSTYTIFFAGTCYAQEPSAACYANCDGSTVVPFLNVADFGCFLSKFAAGDAWANCDGSTVQPVLNVADFGCFLSKFAAGCSAP